jgi:hypothetical protein
MDSWSDAKVCIYLHVLEQDQPSLPRRLQSCWLSQPLARQGYKQRMKLHHSRSNRGVSILRIAHPIHLLITSLRVVHHDLARLLDPRRTKAKLRTQNALIGRITLVRRGHRAHCFLSVVVRALRVIKRVEAVIVLVAIAAVRGALTATVVLVQGAEGRDADGDAGGCNFGRGPEDDFDGFVAVVCFGAETRDAYCADDGEDTRSRKC